jgi:hypothetical protein
MIIDWKQDRDAAVRAIRSKRSRFAILLKTKDDAYFLDDWIRHHAAIVGISNLIVFDNDSTDDQAKDILASYGKELLVIRFNGFHNDLHVPERVPELYAALSDSFDYFQFLDSDELLILIRGQRWNEGPMVSAFVDALEDTPVIPAPWLYCAPRFPSLFKFGRRSSDLHDDIRWGKPVISTALNLKGIINHNVQVDRALYSERFPSGLFVLHRAHLSPLQRIRSNVKKLIARNFAAVGESVDELLARDRSKVQDNNIRLYLTEIERLRQIPEPLPAERPKLVPGHFLLGPDSRIEYFGDEEMMLMGALLASQGALIRKALWSAP